MPTKPGVYLYLNQEGQVLYIGKAKNLRARVKSYFKAGESQKEELIPALDLEPIKADLVQKIADLETIVVDDENEALILEANLIRKNKPPYNVVLTDDKYYLFIKVTREDTPRVFPVRQVKSDGARYFGPYSSARSVRQTLKLLRRLFPYLDEKSSPDEWVFPHPLFPPSTDKTKQSYSLNAEKIIRFLKGEREEVISTLRRGMAEAASKKDFEQAAAWRDQLRAVERLEGNQKVFLPRQESFDVISIATDGSRSAANVFSIRQGKLISKNTFLLKHRSQTSETDILRQFLLQYYHDAQDIPGLVFVPSQLPDADTMMGWLKQDPSPTLMVPKRGKKKQLLAMGKLNAKQLLVEEQATFHQETRLKKAVTELAQALQVAGSLERIETYDISNIQGRQAVGSMIVFINGLPQPSQYRKFRIKLDDQALIPNKPNDYAMLQQVLRRRFSGQHQDWKTPDLIIIDGGRGQLNAATEVLSDLFVPSAVAALAKREEEIFIPGLSAPVRLPFNSDALYLIQRMRDEAHRSGLSYHRLLRSKQASRSLLDEIPGIGPKTKKKLLAEFGSLKGIREASLEELKKVIGQKANTLRDYL